MSEFAQQDYDIIQEPYAADFESEANNSEYFEDSTVEENRNRFHTAINSALTIEEPNSLAA